MPRAKKEPERCKVIDKRTGKRCRNKAGDSGMCKRHEHDHKPTGPKTVAGAARCASAHVQRFGIYAPHVPEEKAEGVNEMALTCELRLVRVQLAGMVEKEALIAAGNPPMYTVSEETVRDVVLGDDGQPAGAPGKARVMRKREALSLDRCHALIDRYSGRIAHIERQLVEIARMPNMTDDPNDVAQQMKTALRGMLDITGGAAGEASYEPDSVVQNCTGNGKSNGKTGGNGTEKGRRNGGSA